MSVVLLSSRRRRVRRPTSEFDAARIASDADLPRGFGFARASGATRVNHRGHLETVGNNVLRHTYDPAVTYNIARNPWGDGGVIGGAIPIDWANIAGGLTAVMSARALEADGSQTVTITVSGTSNGNAQAIRLTDDATADIVLTCPALPGDQFAFDVGLEVVAASGCTIRPQINSTSASNFINSNPVLGAIVNPGTGYSRRRCAGALSNAGTLGAVGNILIGGVSAGVPVSAVLRINFPVMVRGTTYLTDSVPLATLAARMNGISQYGLQGIILEEAATNVLANSVGFAGTTLSNIGVTDAAGMAPDGTATASLLDEGTGVTVNRTSVWEAFSTVTGQSYTASAFFKNVTRRFVQLSYGSAQFGTLQRANFDLQNGVLGTVVGGTARIEAYPGGWYRCSFTAVATGTGSGSAYCAMITGAADVRSQTYTGTNQQLLAWGRQVSDRETSHVPTSGVAATRARDNLTLPSGLRGDRLSYVMRFALLNGAAAIGHALFLSQSGSAGNCFRIQVNSGVPSMHKRVDATQPVAYNRGSVPTGFTSAAFAIGGGEALGSWDGAAPVSDTSTGADLATLNTSKVNAGQTNDGPGILLKRLSIWNGRKLPPAQLQRESARAA